MLTIVMYHYVRDDARVHARTIAELEAELDHVAEHYTAVRLEDVVTGGWPENACLLTFDDGLVEHLDVVAPALERRGLTGVFCPPGRAVVERRPLDVQRTQFLLAATPDHEALGDGSSPWPTIPTGSGRRTRRSTATTLRRRCS